MTIKSIKEGLIKRGLKTTDFEAPQRQRFRLRSNKTGKYQTCTGYSLAAKSGIDEESIVLFADGAIDYNEWIPVSATEWIN
jgi:hypothetical protein